MSAKYGKDVRNSIHDAIKEIDSVADMAQESATKKAQEAAAASNTATLQAQAASTSASAAKTSEENAKSYMERAFSATPEGYDALVDNVNMLDIQTTTDATLYGSKSGGLRVNHMVGNTEQRTLSGKNLPSPNPEYPQSIHNTGDCVEMIQGDHDLKTGNYRYNNNYVTCKYHIPCKENDLINIKTEDLKIIYVVYYSDDGFIKIESSITSTTNATFTVPNGCTHFAIDIGLDYTPYPLDTVGKIQLTINGKYVVQIVENWKNCLMITAKSSTTSGVDFSVDKDKGTIACKGTSTGINFEVARIDCKKYYGKKICLSGCPNVGSSITYWCEYVITYNDGTPNRWGIRDYGNSNVITIDENMAEIVYFIVFNNGYTANNLMFKPQLEIGDVFTGFEPYTEKVATIFLDEPLREKDSIKRKDEVIGENRKKGILDLGTLDWDYDDTYHIFNAKTPKAKTSGSIRGRKCYCTHYTDINTTNISNWSGLGSVDNIISCGCSYYYGTQASSAIVITNFDYTDATEFKNAMNGVILEYELAEETFIPLDTASQIAINSLKTFDTVTHITVDSVTQPAELEVEFGKSKVGARVIKNENDNDIDRIERKEMKAQLNELATALVAVGSEV